MLRCNMRRLLLGAALGPLAPIVAMGGCSSGMKSSGAADRPSGTAPAAGEPQVAQAGMLQAQQPGSAPVATAPTPPPVVLPPPAPPHPPVHINLKVVLPGAPRKQKAFVSWGRKKLGDTKMGDSLVVERPYDSGPMDLVVRSEGFFPVHTRVFTDRDDKILVQMTKLADRQKLYGARQELPPPDATAPTPGAPPTPGTPPPGTPPAAPPGPGAGTPPSATSPPPAH